MLMDAMTELILAKRYDAITVQEITDQANIGRSTFYAHFTDKDDLLTDGMHRMLTFLEEPAATRGRATAGLFPTLALLHHIGGRADLYRALVRSRGLTVAMTALQDRLTTVFSERLTARVAPDTTPAIAPPLLAAMTVSMLVTALRTWIAAGLTETAEDIDRQYQIAAGAAIRAGLRPAG